MKSEGSLKQSLGLTNRNHIQSICGTVESGKQETVLYCPNPAASMWQIYEAKAIVLNRGDFAVQPSTDAGLNCKKSAEAIVPKKFGKS